MPTPRPGSRKSSLQTPELPGTRLPRDAGLKRGKEERRRSSVDASGRSPRSLPSHRGKMESPTHPAKLALSPRSEDTPRHLTLDLTSDTCTLPTRTLPPGHPRPTSSSRPRSPHPRSPRSRTPHSGRFVPCTWGEYVQALQDRGLVSRAAVFSRQGRQWAASPHLQVRAEEVVRLVEGYPDCSGLVREGLVLGGRQYTLTRLCKGPMLVGRDGGSGSGCILYLCRSCLLLAQYDDHAQAALCFAAMERVGDFLRERGF